MFAFWNVRLNVVVNLFVFDLDIVMIVRTFTLTYHLVSRKSIGRCNNTY